VKNLILIAAISILSLQMKAQNWVAPAGGYYNNNLAYDLYADNANNCLYNFGVDTNVLSNNVWHNWYPTTNLLRGTTAITFTNNKNYTMHTYNEGGDASKPRSALVRWTNGTDLDTVKIFKGTYSMFSPNQVNNKFYVSLYHDTLNYTSYLSEFDGINFINPVFDTIWQGTHWKGIGKTITYKNEIYAIGTGSDKFSGNYKIIVCRNGIWQPLPPWQGLDNGVIVKMLIYNNRLYFIGGFWQVENSTIPGNSVIAWDGTNWDNLGGGIEYYGGYLQGYANDAVVCNNKIYFVGPFDHAGGLKASKVVTWNDTTWCTIGGDLDSCFTISQVECFKDTIYIEGNLPNVHGVNLGTIGKLKNMNYTDSCGKWMLTSIPKISQAISNISIQPNPVSSGLTINYEGIDPLDKATLLNSLGQSVYEINKPKPKEDIDLSFLASGIYYLKVESKTGQKVFKVVKE
jgi:hypothetical protein